MDTERPTSGSDVAEDSRRVGVVFQKPGTFIHNHDSPRTDDVGRELANIARAPRGKQRFALAKFFEEPDKRRAKTVGVHIGELSGEVWKLPQTHQRAAAFEIHHGNPHLRGAIASGQITDQSAQQDCFSPTGVAPDQRVWSLLDQIPWSIAQITPERTAVCGIW